MKEKLIKMLNESNSTCKPLSEEFINEFESLSLEDQKEVARGMSEQTSKESIKMKRKNSVMCFFIMGGELLTKEI